MSDRQNPTNPSPASDQDKRALLAKLLKEKVAKAKSYRASFGQEWFWFLDRMQSPHFVLHLITAMQLSGKLDVPVLERSVQEIVRRHEVLRASVQTESGLAMMAVATEVSVPLPLTDLRGMSAAQRDAEIERRLTDEGEIPFDIEKGPLVRAQLLRLEDEEHLLIYTLHHCVADDWSRRVFFRELCLLYQAFIAGKSSPLPALTLQHADFAKWQRQQLQGKYVEQRLAYWLPKLEGAPPLLALPSDRPRPPARSGRAGIVNFILDQALYAELNHLRGVTGATPFMVLLAGYNALLARLSGQKDILIGCPVSNRSKADYEVQLGFFANNLVLRTDASGNPTFRELLGRVQRGTLEAIPHQDLPFELLLENLPRDNTGTLSHSPVFQVSFNFIKFPLAFDTPELKIRARTVPRNHTVYDLVLFMEQEGEQVQGSLIYNADIFDRPRVQGMLDAYLRLIRTALQRPNTPLSEFDLGSATEGPAKSGLSDPGPAASSRSPLPAGIEQELAAMWKDLLGMAPTRLEETFFELGGHSLLVAQLLARIKESLGVTLNPMTFMQAPTIAGLAHAIREQQAAQGR
jgi:acyl carrier protein